MFEDRLRALLGEIEEINYFIQQGCIDREAFSGMKETTDPDHAMNTFDHKTGVAFTAIEQLLEEFYDLSDEEIENGNN